jgi:hypothetical protein
MISRQKATTVSQRRPWQPIFNGILIYPTLFQRIRRQEASVALTAVPGTPYRFSQSLRAQQTTLSQPSNRRRHTHDARFSEINPKHLQHGIMCQRQTRVGLPAAAPVAFPVALHPITVGVADRSHLQR